jgi:predicted GNAT superfamily acetyltransferase
MRILLEDEARMAQAIKRGLRGQRILSTWLATVKMRSGRLRSTNLQELEEVRFVSTRTGWADGPLVNK